MTTYDLAPVQTPAAVPDDDLAAMEAKARMYLGVCDANSDYTHSMARDVISLVALVRRTRVASIEIRENAVAAERARCVAVCRAVALEWRHDPNDMAAAAGRMALSEAREFIGDGRAASDVPRTGGA